MKMLKRDSSKRNKVMLGIVLEDYASSQKVRTQTPTEKEQRTGTISSVANDTVRLKTKEFQMVRSGKQFDSAQYMELERGTYEA